VRVHNRGSTLVLTEDKTFALLPHVASISPSTGSLGGGTKVTLTGAGFMGERNIQSQIIMRTSLSHQAYRIKPITSSLSHQVYHNKPITS